jgi:hypothetical protein
MRKQQLPKFLTISESIERLSQKLAAYPDRQAVIAARIACLKSRKEEFERMEITPKDRRLACYIADYGLIETSALLALAGGSLSRGKRRLHFLWQSGLCKRLKIDDATGLVYYPTRKGIALVADLLSGDLESIRKQADDKRIADYAKSKHDGDYGELKYVKHTLKKSRFRARLELACRNFAGVSYENWVEEQQLCKLKRPKLSISYSRDSDTFKAIALKNFDERAKIIPDFTARLLFDDPAQKPIMIFGEMERDTNSGPEIMRKAWNYHCWFAKAREELKQKGLCLRVIFETESQYWCERMIAAVQSMSVTHGLFLFTYSDYWNEKKPVRIGGENVSLPRYLREPTLIFSKCFASPKDFDPENPVFHSILGDDINALQKQQLPAYELDLIEELSEMKQTAMQNH